MSTTTIETLDDAAAALEREFPDAHVNVMSDVGIEVYRGEPFDAYFIEQVTDDETGELEGWMAREGWGDATYPHKVHVAEVYATCDTLDEAVALAIEYLHDPERQAAPTTGEILGLLELESARSYLTGADYAQIMSGVANIVGLARDHAVAEGEAATTTK